MKSKSDPEALARAIMDPRTHLCFDLSATPLSFRAEEGWVAEGPGLPAHLVYFCRGGGVMRARVGGKVFTCKAEQGVWIRPGTPYRLESADGERPSFTRFRLEVRAPGGGEIVAAEDCWRGDLSSGGMAWLEILHQEVLLGGERDTAALRAALAGLLARGFAKARRESAGHGLSLVQIRDLHDWVKSLPSNSRPTTADMAKRLRLSTGYASRLCRQSFGMSAERWLIQQRIRAAARRLAESDRTVGEVAAEFGFTSLYFFSRQFRQVMKTSPREWRGR
jgi:AraC-like DNA-binding protein